MFTSPKRGFTLVELIVAIFALALAATMLFPSLARNRESGCHVTCSQNMSQIYKAIIMYETDFEMFPTCAAKGKNPLSDGDAQTALNILYRQYIDDVRVFSCPSRPIRMAVLASISPSTEVNGTHFLNGTFFKESQFGSRPNLATSYGYSPGHTSINSRVVILADRLGLDPNGQSDNHGISAGQNVLSAGGGVAFVTGKQARQNNLGKDDQGGQIIDTDIFSDNTITNGYSDWESFCR